MLENLSNSEFKIKLPKKGIVRIFLSTNNLFFSTTGRNPELILTVRGIGYASQRVGETATSLAS